MLLELETTGYSVFFSLKYLKRVSSSSVMPAWRSLAMQTSYFFSVNFAGLMGSSLLVELVK